MSVKDSTNSSVSDKELNDLKRKDPLSALKLMMSLRSSSTDLAKSSSTTSLTSVNPESPEVLLGQLKAKVLEGNLLAKIEDNSVECFEIKGILQKLHKSEPKQELLAFLLEFGPLFEQLSTHVTQRSSMLKWKNVETKLYEEESKALKNSQDIITTMEEQGKQDKEAIVEWNSTIQRYNEEIVALQEKVRDAEHQRNLVQERLNDSSVSKKMEAEAITAISHFDNAAGHQAIITQLDKDLGYLNTSIALNTSILYRLKNSLQSL